MRSERDTCTRGGRRGAVIAFSRGMEKERQPHKTNRLYPLHGDGSVVRAVSADSEPHAGGADDDESFVESGEPEDVSGLDPKSQEEARRREERGNRGPDDVPGFGQGA